MEPQLSRSAEIPNFHLTTASRFSPGLFLLPLEPFGLCPRSGPQGGPGGSSFPRGPLAKAAGKSEKEAAERKNSRENATAKRGKIFIAFGGFLSNEGKAQSHGHISLRQTEGQGPGWATSSKPMQTFTIFSSPTYPLYFKKNSALKYHEKFESKIPSPPTPGAARNSRPLGLQSTGCHPSSNQRPTHSIFHTGREKILQCKPPAHPYQLRGPNRESTPRPKHPLVLQSPLANGDREPQLLLRNPDDRALLRVFTD
jgi:hypothetical protein